MKLKVVDENMNGGTIRINRVPATIAAIVITCLLVYFVNFHQEERPGMYAILRNQNKVSLRQLLIAAVQAAQRGGLEVLEVANSRIMNEKSKGKTDEGANDPFTDADGRSHCVMKLGLRRLFPRVTIFSEEDKQQCSDVNTFDLDNTVLHETASLPDDFENVNDVTVWIDPLDATQEFTGQYCNYYYLFFA